MRRPVSTLDSQLDRLVPVDEQAFGDWDDVLARAGIRRRRPVAAAAIVAALVLVALFVSPAFGILTKLIGRIDVPFAGKPAAPTRVQRDFFSMSIAAPPGMSPEAIPSQTRRVGTLAGRALYVAPTRRGGYCFVFDHFVGGCDPTRPRREPALSVGWSGGPSSVETVEGEVRSQAVRTVSIEYAGGKTLELPFIWVSKPIDAGFFLERLPEGHPRIKALVARDVHGGVVARGYVGASPLHTPPRHAPLPPARPPAARPFPPPSAPLQQASAPGLTVVVGANGIAEFRTSDPAYLRASWACLKFMRYFETVPFELSTAPQTHRGDRTDFGGLRGPMDGCEVQEGYGHVWPDPHGYHAAVEIAFTARARRFFADRAAARELALYLRWSKHHPHAPTTGIAVARHGSETTYSVRSTTGKVFAVTTRGNRIVRQNVEPFAGPL